MLKILRNIFKSNPQKSTIILKDKCSVCGCEVKIEITPTSRGFGLQGGGLLKRSNGGYFAKCPVCYKAIPKIIDEYNQIHGSSCP